MIESLEQRRRRHRKLVDDWNTSGRPDAVGVSDEIYDDLVSHGSTFCGFRILPVLPPVRADR